MQQQLNASRPHDAPDGWRSGLRQLLVGGRTVVLGGAAVIVALLMGAGWLAWSTYDRDSARAATTAANLSITLAAHARQTLGGADRVLVDVLDDVKGAGIGDEPGFRMLYSRRAVFDQLRAAAAGMPQIDVISVADSEGRLLNFTRGFPAADISVADRDYFQAAIKPGVTGMFLGKPVQNKVTSAWTFYLARQVTAADGTPLGVIQVGVSVNFFQDFYRDINIGAGSAISLFRGDGLLLARAPARDNLLGESFASQAVFAEGILRGRRAGVLHVSDARLADGQAQPTRLLAFQALDEFPVVVNTTLTEDMYLASTRNTITGIALGTLVMAAAILALSLALARMMARLDTQQRMLAVTLNAMNQGIMLITPDRRVPVINRRARALLALPEKVETLAGIADTGGPAAKPGASLGDGFEVEYTSPGGAILRVEQTPLRDGGAVRIVTDVTDQRRSEAHLRQAQRLDALGQLTAGIAHDFNNILAVIIASVDLLSDRRTLSERELFTIIDRVRDASQTAADLVRAMLNFSRQQDLRCESVDLSVLLSRSLKLLRQAVAEQLTLRVDLPQDLWPAEVDPAHLESALLNLVLNARDASQRGGLVLLSARNVIVSGDPDQGHPAELLPGAYVVMTVADHGSGIDPAVLPRVFEPFFSTKAVGHGTGLGLSMVFGTMRQMGGAVRIESTLKLGTSVHLYLPRGRTAPVPAPRPAPQLSTHNHRILLVEDNVDLRHTTTSLLRALGHEVVAANDADEALEIWRTDKRFDIVFSDVIMPGSMNGVELVLALRREAPALKLLLTSGYADPGGALDTIRAEGLRLIPKPYRKADLVSNLAALLESASPD